MTSWSWRPIPKFMCCGGVSVRLFSFVCVSHRIGSTSIEKGWDFFESHLIALTHQPLRCCIFDFNLVCVCETLVHAWEISKSRWLYVLKLPEIFHLSSEVAIWIKSWNSAAYIRVVHDVRLNNDIRKRPTVGSPSTPFPPFFCTHGR